MDPIGPGMSASLSGLAAARQRVARSAHNVANVNTERFEARREVQVEAPHGGVRSVGSRPTGDVAPVALRDGVEVTLSNTSVASETVQRIQGIQAYRANLSAMRAQDEAMQSLLERRG